VTERAGRLAQRLDLRVGGRILRGLSAVAPARDDRSADHDHGSHRHVAGGCSGACLRDRLEHPGFVDLAHGRGGFTGRRE
jgi:hypothetical protein